MRKTTLFITIGLLISNMIFAQSQKMSYLDSRELLKAMPEMTRAENDLQTYSKQFQDQLQSMNAEYETKVKEFQAAEKTMTDAAREVKIKEIQDLSQRIQTTKQGAQDKVEKKRLELLQPIMAKANTAIKEVAKEKNYDYVFDSSTGSLLHAKESNNILPLVKAKLGIK